MHCSCFAAPGVATPAANTFLAVSQSPQPKNPYMQQWSLGVQRELFARTALEINYIGTRGSNLLMRRNIAQALPYDPANPQSVSARKPFPNFGTYIDSDWNGYSRLQRSEHEAGASRRQLDSDLRLYVDEEHRLEVRGGWHRRKRIQRLAGLPEQSRPERDHGLSDFDVDHRLVGSFVYNLPFGNGEKFAGDATGVKNAVIGGWQMNGIYTWQRGFPLTITAADPGGLNDTAGTNRADLVSDPILASGQ